MSFTVLVGEEWRFKPNRGSGQFTIARYLPRTEQVTLINHARRETISLHTLRSDYERIPGDPRRASPPAGERNRP